MLLPREAALLRIFIGETDRYQGTPLFEALVRKAHQIHMAGATVLRGPLGFGTSNLLHSEKILRLSENLPMVVEIVDSGAKIEEFLAVAKEMIGGTLVTLEKVQVLRYGEENLSSA
jgi:PII-like signaling protein